MSAHRTADDLNRMYATGSAVIYPPASGGTFDLSVCPWGGTATVGAGTYKLPDNMPVGTMVIIIATGSVTIQNQLSSTVATLTNGQMIKAFARSATQWASIGPGAAGLSVTDTNSYTTQTTAEGWMNELASNQRVIEVDIARGILAAGTPLAAFADNAGAPAPGITLVNSEAVGIRWNNQGTQNAPVWFNVPMPYQGYDFTSTFIPTVHVLASKIGATVGDATTFTITSFTQSVGLLHDDSSSGGGATTAMTGNATSKTVQEVTLALQELVGGTLPKAMSLSITPTTGTLGTDDVIVHRIWLTF